MVSKILSKIILNDTWQVIDLKSFNDCYLIAIKDKKDKKDTIDPNEVKAIKFELGIDSGIKNKPLTIQTVKINFDDMTSFNNDLNEITAFTRLMNIPSEFYIRVVGLETKDYKEVKEGQTSICININAVDLG